MGVGAEICAPTAVDCACFEDARKRFVGDTDAGIGLPVFKKNVVTGIIFLYETVLQ